MIALHSFSNSSFTNDTSSYRKDRKQFQFNYYYFLFISKTLDGIVKTSASRKLAV